MVRVEDITHDIVPDGDVILYLKNPNAPFAVWPTNPSSPEDQHDHDDAQNASPTEHTPDKDTKESPKIFLRLSSKHLIVASKYFNRMLQGPWRESQDNNENTFQLTAEDWDEEALLIVMNIIHSRSRQLPRIMDLELLAKITIIVDYYQCHESVQFHVEFWFNFITKNARLPTQINREAILWLHVSWVFSNQDIFKAITRTVQMNATRPVPSLDLPVHRILEDIEKLRTETASKAISFIQSSIKTLSGGKVHTCNKEECVSMLLGVVIRHAAKYHLFPLPESPYHGISFSSLIDLDVNFHQPTWYLGSPSSAKTAAVAKEASKMAYQNGYRAGVGGSALYKKVDPLDGYDEHHYRVQSLAANLVTDPAHGCSPTVFGRIRKMVSEMKCGFDLKDFDSIRTPAFR